MKKSIIFFFPLFFVLLFTKNVYAEETTKFASLNQSASVSTTVVLLVQDTVKITNAFALADKETEDDFSVQDEVVNAKHEEVKLTDEVIQEEVVPEINQIKEIVQTEIQRQKDEEEKQKKAEEARRIRLEQQRRERNTQQVKNNSNRQISVDISNANGGSLDEILLAQLGKPYVYGGNGPNSFDCSGLAKYVYGKIGVTLPRVASDQQYVGTAVERTMESLKFGDLVFFAPPGRTSATHVGIYVGNGQMIHAPQTGDVVKYSPIFEGYFKNRFFAARRVL